MILMFFPIMVKNMSIEMFFGVAMMEKEETIMTVLGLENQFKYKKGMINL